MNKKLGDINVTVGNNNQIGNIGHVVNVNSKVVWGISDKLRQQLIETVPKDKLAAVWFTSGNEDSIQVAEQIYRYMKECGFSLWRWPFTANLSAAPARCDL